MIIYLYGLFTIPVVLVIGIVLLELTRTLMAWCQTKHRELKARKVWHYENPYWEEAFEAGAKWADEGKPPSKPNLSRLKGD